MSDFYRKESETVFNERFKTLNSRQGSVGLNGHLIFQAKNYTGEKVFTVTTAKGVTGSIRLKCTVVDGPMLRIVRCDNSNTLVFEGDEVDVAAILNPKSKLRGTLKYEAIAKICKDHATSSAHSPLISGCKTNNFSQNTRYPGRKLHLVLKVRTPFSNPHVSGNEREYFLIGQVHDTDCKQIEYLGRTMKVKNTIKGKTVERIVDEKKNIPVEPVRHFLPQPSDVREGSPFRPLFGRRDLHLDRR
ncbi:hypothetical protein [Hyalangium minutum]|uniref:hypothetical protein n=1 Tax=Hyalangium minutum TaxID=394096 RepID=UPI0012F72DAF|nr:hypothetical protein [Hyalangium minutum]